MKTLPFTMTMPFFMLIILALSSGMLNAMDGFDHNPTPLKRSRGENRAMRPTKVDYIASLDASLKEIDEDGNTVLHVASREGNLGMVRDLLSRGANSCKQNKQGQTALHCAVSANHHEIVQQLIQGMPSKARRERIMTTLRALPNNQIARVLRLKILSYLPELIIAYPRLCRLLVPQYMLAEQLYAAQITPQIELLSIIDTEGHMAYDIAKNNRNGFMARMTNPKNRPEVCKEEVTCLLEYPINTESKENKE